MKHFYTLSVAVALALSAGAKDFHEIKQLSDVVESKACTNIVMQKVENSDGIQRVRVAQKAKAKAPSVEELAGEYVITIGDYYFESSVGDVTESCIVTVDGTTVTFSSEYFFSDIIGTYDAANATIAFEPKKLGSVTMKDGSTMFAKFFPFVYTVDAATEEGAPVEQNYSAVFTGDAIEFEANHGFAWGAYENKTYSKILGYFDLFNVVSMEKGTLDNGDGNYVWSGEWLLNNASALPMEIELSEVDEATGEAMLVNVMGGFNIPCTIDAEAMTLTIVNKTKIGADSDGDIYFYLKGFDSEGKLTDGASTASASVGTIGEDGVVTFPELDVWAFGDPEAETLGWYVLSCANVFAPIDPNADPNEGWTSVGEATFYDPWISPAYTGYDPDYSYTVEMQQNDNDKNTYRLVNPYKASGFKYLANNQSSLANGYIQFNIADPNHVEFKAVEAGFASSSMGITKLYCYDVLSSYIAQGYSAMTVITVQGDKIPYTTYKDGVVTLGSKEETDENGNTSIRNAACFAIQDQIGKRYTWQNSAGETIPMLGKIIFPEGAGVDDVAVDESNAPVEYYNLQGMKVENPANGLYIKKQGSKATKVFVR